MRKTSFAARENISKFFYTQSQSNHPKHTFPGDENNIIAPKSSELAEH